MKCLILILILNTAILAAQEAPWEHFSLDLYRENSINNEGLLASEIYYDLEDEITLWKEYSYDDEGRISTLEYFTPQGAPMMQHQYIYEGNQLMNIYIHHNSDFPNMEIEHYYNGDLLQERRFYSLDQAGSRWLNQVDRYTYDYSGRIIRLETFKDGALQQSEDYHYDAYGQLEWVGICTAEGFVGSRYYSYDEWGKPTSMQLNGLNCQTLRIEVYDTDRHGNIIEAREYH